MIFDSDVLIWYCRDDPEAIAIINQTPDRALSIVSMMEVYQGARSKTDLVYLRQSLRNLGFRTLHLTEAIGHAALDLIEEHSLTSGLRVEDALIAATALQSGEVLATGNTRHFAPIRRLALQPFRPHRRHK